MRRSLLAAAWLATLAVFTGCTSLQFTQQREPNPLAAPAVALEGEQGRWASISADALGNLVIQGEPLRLDTAREYERFGVSLANAGDLPVNLRPAYLADGGVVVTGLAKASPLAIAGVRVLDRLLEIAGEPVLDADSAIATLLDRGQGHSSLRVARVGVESKKLRCNVDREQFIGDAGFGIPFVYSYMDGPLASSWSVGPGLFSVQSKLQVSDDVSYTEIDGWSALLGLVNWQRVTDLDSRRRDHALRLAWFFTVYRGGNGERK